MTADALADLAKELGLTVASLDRLRVGWSGQAWAFPMTGADGRILGIRLRLANGRKLAVRGGREGLFVPTGLSWEGQLLVSEGPTDCGALLDLGFDAIGRPSCTGGVRLIVELVKARRPATVVIVADPDAPGQRGAAALASVLVAFAPAVRVIRPPDGIEDARAWVQAGGTRRDVEQAIEAAPVRRLAVRTAAPAAKKR